MPFDWRNRKVLVTGAGGFIGSHLVERLIGLGVEVTAFIRYTSRASVGFLNGLAERVRIVAGDLTEYESVQEATRDKEVVFHLGALIGVPYSFVHPREVVDVNTIGTLNVLTATKEVRPHRVVLTSTSEVYGTARYIPIDEGHPLQAQSPYAASKIAADKLGEAFHRSYGLAVATARPFNTFGPRQSTRAVIPTITVQALCGDRIRLGATSPLRDFTYVKDTVRGFLRMAEVPEAVGEVVNFASGTEISIGDLATIIARLLGKRVEVDVDNARLRPQESEVHRLCGDNRKAKQLLGWEPEYTLEQGLLETVDWLRRTVDPRLAKEYRI